MNLPKLIFGIQCILLMRLSAVAQPTKDFSFEFGPAVKMANGGYSGPTKLIAYDEKYLYGLDDFATELVRYNRKELTINTNAQINLKGRHLIGCRKYGGKTFLFSISKPDSSGTVAFYAQLIMTDAAAVSRELTRIAEVKVSKSFDLKSSIADIVCSPDGMKLLCVLSYANKDLLRKGLWACALQEDFKMMWSKDMPYAAGDFVSVDKLKFLDNGDVYVLSKRFKNSDDQIDYVKLKYGLDHAHFYQGLFSSGIIERKANYIFEMQAIRFHGQTTTGMRFGRQGMFINEMRFAVLDSSKIILAGLCSNEGRVSVKGCFTMALMASADSVLKRKIFYFENSFTTQGLSSKNASQLLEKISRNEEYDTDGYELNNIVLNDNGTYSLVAEHHRTITYPSKRGYAFIWTDQYNDIIICNFGGDGELLWKQKIIKNQSSNNRTYDFGSFYLFPWKSNLYFFYNNEYDDREFNENRAMGTVAKVDAEGNITSEQLFSWKDEKRRFMPHRFIATSDSEFYFWGLQIEPLKENLLKISFK